MKQVSTFLSTYTADVSGVPSALYELGGMIIMHDASGCNSTYNTHDEPRWYDSKSMVYITGLTEIEAIMGDDNKFVDDIVREAKSLHPKFIVVAGTPIPMIIGSDIKGLARMIMSETNIKTFGIETNGMHSYVEGAGEALYQYAKYFVKKDVKKIENSVNILGATPIDFSVNGQVESIEKFFTDNGISIISNFAFGKNTVNIPDAGRAAVNIVVSSVGIKVAEYLKKEFGTPYIVGIPYGDKLKKEMIYSIKNISESSKDGIIYLTDFNKDFKDEKIYIIGESVASKSLAKYIYYKYGKTPLVISAVEGGNTYHGDVIKELKIRESAALESQDIFADDEDEIENIIKGAKMVIADPLYKPIISKNTIFIKNPHEGFSGRLFRKEIMNLINL